MTALISLEKEEFINFFVNHDCEKEFYDDIYFGINNNLNKNSKKFWDSLFYFLMEIRFIILHYFLMKW